MTKKIYCSTCQKMVLGVEQKTDNAVRVACPKCKQPIWMRENMNWRYIKPAE